MKTEQRVEQIFTIGTLVLLGLGCFLILQPFFTALAWSAILCFTTWPIYSGLIRLVKERKTLAALLMTLMIVLIIFLPILFLGLSVADNVSALAERFKNVGSEGLPPPPTWIEKIPFAGSYIASYWSHLPHDGGEFVTMIKNFFINSRGWFVDRGLGFGQGLLQLFLSIFISFFFYRDGILLTQKLQLSMQKIIGDRTKHLLQVVEGTVKGVVYGILGTALAQAVLASLGFWATGIPMPFMLGVLTFFLSPIPIGPPLIWVPAGLSLIYQGEKGWGIGLLIWGFAAISMVDNFIKPYLISRGSNLPFVLVMMGIMGGAIIFGVIGVFIGPTILAVGYSLLQEWIAEEKVKNV